MKPIIEAEEAHRTWLEAALGEDFQAQDYKRRRKKMTKGPFPFLRATYWRWCEYPLGFAADRRVLSVGDIHVENFGTWRDEEGRLVFGVNDFDEAAEMPWPHDLVRLVTSALLGAADAKLDIPVAGIAATVLEGYGRGTRRRQPIILDGGIGLWDRLVLTTAEMHRMFWQEEESEAAERPADPLPRYRSVLHGAFPDGAVPGAAYARKAGTGSLGRPRYAAIAGVRGGRALREVKRLLPSAWSVAQGEDPPRNRTAEAACGPTRSPDAWFAVVGGIAVRRLSPNNRKIEFPDPDSTVPPLPPPPLDEAVLEAMGHDIGALHAARPEDGAAIAGVLEAGRRDPAWLAAEATRLAGLVRADHKAWKKEGPD